jgi:DNA repair protein RecN (Recombination protein N)
MIADLGMPHGRLEIVVEPVGELTSYGKDSVALLFSANEKTAPQPVERVASGGEVSRLMLVLKALMAKNTKLPTIIFDEIDAGVSGRIADAVGEIIVSLAESMQVINITHLPQVASKGDTHFLVYKESSATKIELLTSERRVEEIAKMLSGSAITEAAIAQAINLIGK